MENVSFGIKKIKDTEFFVDESIEIDPQKIGMNFELKTNINLTETTVELVLLVVFRDNISEKPILRIRTSNIFLIPELASFKKKDDEAFDLPDVLLTTMLSLSISHTRALLAKNAVGTKFADVYIPIVNPAEMAKKLFTNNN